MSPNARLVPLVATLALALLCGCARRETEAAKAGKEQTLLLGNAAEPEDLDPQTVTAYTDQNILLALFEGLTAIDEKTSQAIPAAATSWETSPDGLTWTFHLRDNLKWSNGEPLTAGDFVTSWRRILTPALGSEYANLLYAIRNAEAFNMGRISDATQIGASAPDSRTVRLELDHPVPFMPALVAQPPWFPVNARVLERFSAMQRRATAWTRPGNLVGNGPFVLSEWVPNDRIVVTANPNYWKASEVALHAIVFKPIESEETEEHEFRAGQLHVTFSVPSSRIGTYLKEDSHLLRIDPSLQTFFLRFNTQIAPFSDVRVRRALSLVIDRDLIARTVLAGRYPAAHAFTPDACGGYTPRARIDTDAELARQLLAQAGYPGGKGMAPVSLQALNNTMQPPMAEAIQDMWLKQLGVHAEITVLEQKTWIQNQQSLHYGVSTSGWIGDYVDPQTFLDLFVGNGGNNWTGWSDPRYDSLILAAEHEADATKRLEIFQQAEERLLAESPVTPLVYGSRAQLISPSVKGWEPALLGFHQYAKIRIAP